MSNPHQANDTPDYLALGYTPEQVTTLQSLELLCRELGLSHEAFAAAHLSVSSTTWLRIRKGTYGASRESVFNRLDISLRNLRIELAKRHRLTGGLSYYWFAPGQAVMNAITTARTRKAGNPERLVIAEGETGMGKTALGVQIRMQHDALYLEASESWRTDYRAAAAAIARAAGVPAQQVSTRASTAEIEERLIEGLSSRRRVLIIDEAEYFGPKTANLLKLILNRTETVIVLLCIPQLRARWMAVAQQESRQLLRRASVIELGRVTPGEVDPFLEELPLGANRKQASQIIARAGNLFGGFSTVLRVVERLHEDGNDTLDCADVNKAIEIVQHLQRRGGEQ